MNLKSCDVAQGSGQESCRDVLRHQTATEGERERERERERDGSAAETPTRPYRLNSIHVNMGTESRDGGRDKMLQYIELT